MARCITTEAITTDAEKVAEQRRAATRSVRREPVAECPCQVAKLRSSDRRNWLSPTVAAPQLVVMACDAHEACASCYYRCASSLRDCGETKPGGRGWTEPAKETPVRLMTWIPIRVDHPNDPPGFHSCLAPTPAPRCVSRAAAMFRICGPPSPKHARRCFSGNPQTTYSVDRRLRSTSALGPWGSEAPSTAGLTS